MSRVILFMVALLGFQTAIAGEKGDRRPLTVGYLENSGQGCTGTLITPKIVLTAAHCVRNQPVEAIRFTLTKKIFDREIKFAKAAEVAVSPEYRPATAEAPAFADLAVVKLQSTDYGTVPPGFYPLLSAADTEPGVEVATIGYGYNPGGTNGSRRARRVRFETATSATTGDGKAIAGAILQFQRGATGQIPCTGDDGAPYIAIAKGKAGIVGIVGESPSSGPEASPESACQAKKFSHGASVTAFREWIESVLPEREIATTKPTRGFGPELMGLVPSLPE